MAGARAVAEETVRAFDVPGMVIAASAGPVQGAGQGPGQDGAPIDSVAVGADAQGRALTSASVLPVASITKVATALALLRLIGAGEATLDDPLARHLPAAHAAVEGVTLRRLLSHTAGAPIDIPPAAAPYAPGLSWASVRQPLLDTPLLVQPGTQVIYSNCGIGLLALVIERICGQHIHAAVRELVIEPLGIEAWLGEEPPRSPSPIAGDLGRHAGTPLEPYNTPFYRALGFPWGGMICTAEAALRLVRALASHTASTGDAHQRAKGFLPGWLRDEAVRDQTTGLAGGFTGWMEWSPCPWGLGVEIKGTKRPHFTPRQTSPSAFGHLGWSGAIAWHDPEFASGAGLTWAILGARTWGPWCSRMVDIATALYDAAPTGEASTAAREKME